MRVFFRIRSDHHREPATVNEQSRITVFSNLAVPYDLLLCHFEPSAGAGPALERSVALATHGLWHGASVTRAPCSIFHWSRSHGVTISPILRSSALEMYPAIPMLIIPTTIWV